MKTYSRIGSVPPYLFSDLDKLKTKMIEQGIDIIDISIGDPDLPTPEFIIEALCQGALNKKNHRYPPYEGTREFRYAVADYYKRRFGVKLDADNEIVSLIGSKEGIAHLSTALIDNNDIALIPDPAYPIYNTSVLLSGGKPHILPLIAENNFLPDLGTVDSEIAKRAKLMFVNYPNNPTGAICDLGHFQSMVEFAKKNDLVICNDAAYSEIVFDNIRKISILNAADAKEVVIEIGTLSKSYNMTGWRIGYAVGNSEILKKLMIVKTNTDSGQFAAVQHAACAALRCGDEYIEYLIDVYRSRRITAVSLLNEIGIYAEIPKGSFYVWFKVPGEYSSKEFASRLAQESGVIVTPGSAFGKFGEGYCRIALTVEENRLKEAIYRIKRSMIK